MNHAHFFVDRVIVHEVISASDRTEDASITLSNIASDIDDELRNFFRERIIRSIADGFDIEEDAEQDSPVPNSVKHILETDAHLVHESQTIARHLHRCQTAVNSSGLVVICTGTIDNARSLALLKLQRQEAIRAQLSSSDDQTTFDLAHLRDLMLSEDTRVFKAALFSNEDGFVGRASDNQRGYEPRDAVANFFLVKFLGCKLKHQPELATKAFLENTQEFINEKIDDPEKKARYEIALLQELNSQSTRINVERFASENFEPIDRTTYRVHMRSKEDAVGSFDKNVALVESRLRRLSATFVESGLKLSGPPDAFESYVEVNDASQDGGSRVTINDQISRFT